MTTSCDYIPCSKVIKNPKPGQRFCPMPATCRQKWHWEQHLPGVVSGIRQLKAGGWSVTTHYRIQPSVRIGERVSLEIDRKRRPYASTEDKQ